MTTVTINKQQPQTTTNQPLTEACYQSMYKQRRWSNSQCMWASTSCNVSVKL